MKKPLCLLIVLAIFICGCQKTAYISDNQNIVSYESSLEEENVTGISSSCSSDVICESQTDNGDISVITMKEKYNIEMPYSPGITSETGEKFAKAMTENPLDKAFNKEMNEWSGATYELYDICDKYIALWEKEIDFAIESLGTVLDADRIKSIKAYSEEYIKISEEKINIETDLFRDYRGTGVDFGTIMSCYTTDQHISIYRDLTFRLKYWMYILETETENAKGADLSLKFIFEE